MQLKTLTDDELLRWAHTEFDALTSTELEAELLRRFEESAALAAQAEALLDLMDEHSLADAEALRNVIEKAATLEERVNGVALLDVLREFDIDVPAELRKQLDRIAKFDQVMEDLKSPLASLQQLATTE